MKYLKRFNENLSKHKGDSITPTKVYHKSNPIFREKIKEEGLLPKKGDSYSAYSPEDNELPAIFGYIGDDINYYDSTYDDDIWLIDAENSNNKWFRDKAVGKGKYTVMTYTNIPVQFIQLIYKGTGDSY
jgi:hypothetical protein